MYCEKKLYVNTILLYSDTKKTVIIISCSLPAIRLSDLG